MIGPDAEREERPILLLNIFQSARESAPVLPDPARPRESTCPESERPFGVPSERGG